MALLKEKEIARETEKAMLTFQTQELEQNLKSKQEMNSHDFKRQSKVKLKELATRLSRAEKVKAELEVEIIVQDRQVSGLQDKRRQVEHSLAEEETQRVFREKQKVVAQAEQDYHKAEQQKGMEEARLKDLESFRTEQKVIEERLNSLYDRLETLFQEITHLEDDTYARQVEQQTHKLYAQDFQAMAWQMDIVVLEQHQKKITQINSIISDYWSRIYQGEDIATIKVKATQESSQNDNTKKSYKYSIV